MANSLLDAITSPLTGEYRKKKPLSVQMAETGLDMTPVGTALEVGEELSSDKPSWLNIGLAVAPDVLGLGPVADPLMKAIKGTKFKTAKGSTYEVQDGNTTVRNKAARPEHPGESGVQPQSVKTIYMPRTELEKFAGTHQNPEIGTEFIPTGPNTAALRYTEDYGPRKAGEIVPGTEVTFTLEPEVGLNPVEILDFKNPKGIHFGNEIIEVESNIPKVTRNNNPTRQVSNVEYDARVAELDSAEDAKTWQTNAEALVKDMRETSPTIRTPELEESAQALRDGKITREQHLKNINTYKPVESWDALPREPSNKATVFSLKPDQREKGRFILPVDTTEALGVTQSGLKVGDRFNGRLDIPAYQRFDTWIVAGTSNAEKGVTHYAKAIHYKGVGDKPVRFAASQKTGEKIGTGEMGKTGYATVSGEIKDLDADAIREKAAALLNDPEWTQVGFDPRRQSSFYVRGADNRHVPVREADEVIQIGPLVLAKNAKLDKDYAGYAKGGVAMDEQMNAVFKTSRTGYALGGDVEVDPVSGNEVPPGSLPEEVRDDIPAMLSEGEYVVPADVLRFYGVKFFEDLRAQAKMGLAEMEANGRIGGEPIEEETGDVGISDEDLMVIMAQAPQEEPQQVMANRGGLMGFQAGGLNFPEYIKQPDLTQFGMAGPDFQGGLEYRTFTNDAGMTITIPFFNGEPMGMIPPGYTEGDAPTATEEAAPQVSQDDGFDAASAQRARDRIAEQQPDKEIDFSDPQSVEGAVNTYYSSQPLLQSATSAVLGLPGLAASYGIKKYEKNNLLKGINSAIEETDDTDLIEKLKKQKELLEDKDKWKTSYEEKTESLGLVDSIKNFLGFGEDAEPKQYNAPEGVSNEDWSKQATGKWVDATNLVQSLGSDADPREWHEAMQAQAEASREATAAAQAASGWTGFFSPPEENDDEEE